MPFDVSNELIVVRPQDMLVARFYLIGCHRDQNEQFNVDSGATPTVIMRLPMQHLAEAPFVPAAAATTIHAASCESQIAFAINPTDIDGKVATLEVLLSALDNAQVKTMTPQGFAALGLADPDITRSDVTDDSRTYFSALELPFRMTISPDTDPIRSIHPSTVTYDSSGQNRETVELWYARLVGADDNQVTLRGLFTRESVIADVTQQSDQLLLGRALGHQELIDLVISNTQPDEKYAISSDLFTVGPLGANAHLLYAVDAPAPGVTSGLVGYKEVITVGQTEYLRVVKLGTLLPLGLRAHLITVNFRRCGHEDTAPTATPHDDAFIDNITYIEIVDPITTIADSGPFGAKQNYAAPYREIRVAPANRRTPPISAVTPPTLASYGDDVQVPYVIAAAANVEHLFNVTLLGHDQVEHAIAIPMTFAVASPAIAAASSKVVQDVSTFMSTQVRNNLPNAPAWVANETVVVGDTRVPTATDAPNILRCIGAGLTGETEPVWSGDSVPDGTSQWLLVPRPTFADIIIGGAPMLFTLPGEVAEAGKELANSTFATFNLAVTLPDVRATDANLLQPLQQMTSATVEVTALKAMGAPAVMKFRYTDDYLQNGLTNAGNVFGQISDNAVSLAFDQLPSKVALALPNMDVVGLSQAIGTIAGDAADVADAIQTAQSANFDPQKTFKAAALSLPTLFGFSLADIISNVPLSFAQAPKVTTSRKNVNGVDVIHVGYEYVTTLQGRPSNGGTHTSFSGATLDLSIGIDSNAVQPDIKAISTRCALRGGDVPLFYLLPDSPQLVGVKIGELVFSADSQNGTAVNLSGVEVTFADDLAFIQQLADALGSILGGGWTIAVASESAIATLSLHVPPLAFGAFALENLHLDIGLTLPFTASGPSLFFSFASRQSPFHVQISIFAGGGFIRIDASTNPSQIMVQGEIEFGGSLSFDLGPIASGCLYLMAGIYFVMKVGESFALQAYIRAGGALSILGGILTASVEFYLALTYDATTGELSGTCSITYEIHILFFSASVTVTMSQHIAGSKAASNGAFSPATSMFSLSDGSGSPTAQQMFPSQDDWRVFMKKFNFA
jgi:hypothetical protein